MAKVDTDGVFKTPYSTFHRDSYAAIDPTQPSLSTKGKSAIVTGAGTGIGAGIAVSLAKSSISFLALVGRREHLLAKTKATIDALSTGTKVSILVADVTEPGSIGKAVAAFAEECPNGRIDILVANAGYLAEQTTVADSDPVDWWLGFEINVKGNFNLLRAFLPYAAPRASLVNISTSAIHNAYMPGQSSYRASKLGATEVFEYVRLENPGLYVLQLHPGLVAFTEMYDKFTAGTPGVANVPFDSVSLPSDFVVWAVSSEAQFLNGRFVWVNWDVEEMKADKEIILANPKKFTMNLVGWA
ncbi:NAD(P)-binding protein [Thozetella sp. PMI_491]|nr:NAD(P)-binding protein [Thozetella sp. PMI_491]